METTNLTGKGRTMRKILKISSIAILSILLISTISHFVWKYSGSNDWKLVRDNNGVKIWTLKVPGHNLLQFKANMRVKSKLSSAVFYVSDNSTGSDVGGSNLEVLEKIDTPTKFWAFYSYSVAIPFPIGNMDAVILLYYTQDSITKIVDVNVLAAPNKTPRVKDSFRLSHMNDIWRLTPLPNGEVDVEVKMDLDGGIPYFLFNLVMIKDLEKNFNLMRDLLKTDKYINGARPYIKEFGEQ